MALLSCIIQMLSETSYLFLFQNKILKVKKTKEKITFFFSCTAREFMDI